MIMVSKPYFNEPGYAEEEGTAAGEQRSTEYATSAKRLPIVHAAHASHYLPFGASVPAVYQVPSTNGCVLLDRQIF